MKISPFPTTFQKQNKPESTQSHETMETSRLQPDRMQYSFSIYSNTDKPAVALYRIHSSPSCLMSKLIRRLVRVDKSTSPQCSNIKPWCHGPNLRPHLRSLSQNVQHVRRRVRSSAIALIMSSNWNIFKGLKDRKWM